MQVTAPSSSLEIALSSAKPNTTRSACVVEDKAGVTGQTEHTCQLAEVGRGRAEAGRGWPEAGPKLEAALSLIWHWRGVLNLEGELTDASGRAGRLVHI